VNGVTETYFVNERDELRRIEAGGVPTRTFAYDLAGRMTSSATSAGTTSYSYDAFGRLTSIVYPDLSVDSFAYNGMGARVGASGASGARTFRRAGASVLASVLGDGLATYTPSLSERRGGESRFFHAGIKSFDAQTDESGSVAATRRYDAFGSTL
jgi:YD repeat-containing protein